MKATIYLDNIDNHHKRQLIKAIKYVNSAQSYYYLSEELKKINLTDNDKVNAQQGCELLLGVQPEDEYKICITSKSFTDDWFCHPYRLVSIISISDWEKLYAPPALKCYLMYIFALALLALEADVSEDMALRIVHEPPVGCLLDFCEDNSNIKLGMVAGNLCTESRGHLSRYGMSQQSIDGIERILEYVRAEAIGKPILTEPNNAFVVMRFSENDENDNAFKYGIKLGLKDVGIQAVRADDTVNSSQLLEKVKKYIDRSRFVVAKIDVDNLNVYFELGLSMGVNKDVLLISEETLILNLPSDLRNWECLTYPKGDYEDLRAKVSKFYEDNYHYQKEIEKV